MEKGLLMRHIIRQAVSSLVNLSYPNIPDIGPSQKESLLDKGKLPLSANNMKAIEDELCSSRDRPWWVSNYWRDPLETFADMEDEMSLGRCKGYHIPKENAIQSHEI
ncbi:hypothetical protein I7I51_02005 [Histoplasma capsulatum]|uniref:Uncharacterized protein n=1 Tax=Ajellomyces capsulatus TaxID=5037 RepID=A0A8A1MIH6_AJECA|nr:hypothetical protein I7I51_02005 [Histoplasma capsulatum]